MSCTQNKITSIIPSSELNIIRYANSEKSCEQEITLITNNEDFYNFQLTLVKSGQRNAPIVTVDFSQYNVAIICKDKIDQYDLSQITLSPKENILYLNKKGIFTDENTNLIIVEIPKKINHLTLKS